MSNSEKCSFILKNFRVNAVCPTVIETDLVRKYKEMSADKAQGRFQRPRVLFFSDPQFDLISDPLKFTQ